MASRFNYGQHIYFPFEKGYTVQDAQMHPRYYLTKETAEKNGNYENLVEYSPVVHAHWRYDLFNPDLPLARCSACGGTDNMRSVAVGHGKYCPFCGAVMDEVGKDKDNG